VLGCSSYLIPQLFLFSLFIIIFYFSTKAIFAVFVRILTHFKRLHKPGALRLCFSGRRSWHQRQSEPFLLFSSSTPSVYCIYLQLFTPGVAPQLCHCHFFAGLQMNRLTSAALKVCSVLFFQFFNRISCELSFCIWFTTGHTDKWISRTEG